MPAGAVMNTILQNLPTAINIGVSTIPEYNSARKEGNNKVVSVAKALGSFAAFEIAPHLMGAKIAIDMGTALVSGTVQNTTEQMKQGYKRRGKFGTGYFNMTEAGYTMRQRSINAIRSNGQNLQSALGNEARNYFRSY